MGKRKSAGLIERAVRQAAKRAVPPEQRAEAVATITGMVEERLVSMSTPLPKVVAESLAMLLSRMGNSECRIASQVGGLDDWAVVFLCKESCGELHCVANAEAYDRIMAALAAETWASGGPDMADKTHGDLYTYWDVPAPTVA